MSGKGMKASKIAGAGLFDVPAPRPVIKVGRNDACPCGSGKKFKQCHEAAGEEYLEKLYHERQRAKRREQLKIEGVPWYRRLFARFGA